ncbi:nucleotidyl transferase AbiEii/AbiGii toxin family protein [Nocardia aurantia]|uniref:Nucleotidyl transferase AbiEii/AbiGii toxin family protein n=1 Tax=Nocardia aurantia TaxID=2585199 RepID=A0A7K0DIU3_9NOCA|nr:nucleotidyl transferase AbiEii/AbiGii toxin family protein [Nocardia aurantia]MQY25723.1 hypothetical protein [Nocardia aurantia]
MSLGIDERATVAAQFGVTNAQVERDHLISLLLAHLSTHYADAVIFFGGTALARTHLPHGRLSEDIDLIAPVSRSTVAADLTHTLPRAAQRGFGRLHWDIRLTDVADTEPARLISADGSVGIKIQLLAGTGIPRWPLETRSLIQRYTDAPAATLEVPTRAAFVAAKTVAWHDRAAPRDLWDLWALASQGAIDEQAGRLFRRHGPTNRLPQSWQFATAPTESEWHAQLSGQTRLTVTAAEALRLVRDAWDAVGSSGS